MKFQNVIAIDGVAYSGKSTVASALAKLTGYAYVNTGHMYRAVAKMVLARSQELTFDDDEGVFAVAQKMRIVFRNKKGSLKTIVNGSDWTHVLDQYEVVQGASRVAAYPKVRALLTERQRCFLGDAPLIMEGRDIGTTVFPRARWKFFITASLEVRAKRMVQLMSLAEKRKAPPVKVLMKQIHQIDERDRARKVSPLRVAKDAILYDNSAIPSPEQDALILHYYLRQPAEIVKNAKLLRTRVTWNR